MGHLHFQNYGAALIEPVDSDVHQSECRRRKLLKCSPRKIDDTTVSDESFGGTAICDGDYNTPARIEAGYAHAAAQWIKPGGGGQFVRIKPLAVSHEFATMCLAIPGGQSSRRGGATCGGTIRRQQQAEQNDTFHTRFFVAATRAAVRVPCN